MATSRIHIIDTQDGISDGIVQTPDKRNIGRAWQNEAPVGHFITVSLEGHWIITEDEYNLLSKLKRENAKIKTAN
jgi:hypothetical protein